MDAVPATRAGAHDGEMSALPRSARPSGAWWSRTRGLPTAVHESWRRDVAVRQGRPDRVLAWARAESGFCLGSPVLLSVGDEDAWDHVAWHRIEHGGWNAESRTLSWSEYGGRRGRTTLSEAGRLPELFRERVAASIAVERFVALAGERGVTVTARRDLSTGTLSWHSTLTRGLTWSQAGVAEATEQAMAELQAEYGSGPVG